MKECSVMLKKILKSKALWKLTQSFVALMCSALLLTGDVTPVARFQEPAADASQQDAAPLPPDQLDSLVAPIALYPDPLLAQMLAASTYPLELVQLQQWLAKNKTLKDKALVDAVEKEPWDPSVQAMAVVPDALKRLTDDIQWTTDLGNAFLAQQSDVMEAVQRMRAKAEGKGNLKSTEQMKVETKVVESKSVIVIEQSNPQVVYVPSYDPVVVYGAPVYPYPPIYYPPPGYYAAGAAISFGVGMMVGAAISGGWGWGCGWGGNNNITINNNNNFNRNSNINGGNRNNINGGNRNNINGGNRPGGGGNNWQHNPQHRGGTPYGNKATANKFGGTSRGDSMSNRQSNARQNQGQRGGGQQAGNMDRGGGGRQQSGAGNRASGGGGDRVGDRSTSPGSRSSKSDAFGGASRGSTGSSAKASSSRGSSSMGGSRGGGGGSRGGGGRRR
jgi:Protein of unknown function (DUF3300)